MITRCAIAALVCALSLCAQSGSPVTITPDPPIAATVQLGFYNSAGSIAYICRARQIAPQNTWAVGNGLTSIVVSSDTATITFGAAPGMYVGLRLTVSGATAASGLNGEYKVASVSGSTVTVATSGVNDATFNGAGLTVATTWPLTGAGLWAIQAHAYDASGSWAGSYWAGNGSTAYYLRCSDRAKY
jgi:hypothetical protein